MMYNESIASFHKSLATNNTSKIQQALIYLQLGQIKQDLHLYSEAQPLYQQGLILNPNSSYLHFHQAQLSYLGSTTSLQSSLISLNQSLTHDPNNHQSYKLLGFLHQYELKDYPTALRYYSLSL